MLTDYHVHIERGQYTVDWLRQFIHQAQIKGVKDLGISEHAYRFKETRSMFWNEWVEARQTQTIEDYYRLMLKVREQGMNVKFGIEIDYFPEKEKEIAEFIQSYPFDYVIGSVHWLEDWGIDLVEMQDEWQRRDLQSVWCDYFARIRQMAESKLFDIAAHLDLVKIFNYVPHDRDFLQNQYDLTARVLADSGMCIEISTAGLRKPVKEIYPHPQLLKTCYDYGVPIVISSDAHRPQDVGADFDQAVQLAMDIGYEEVCLFTQRKAQKCRLG